MFTSRRCRYIPLLLLPVLPAVVFAQDGSGEHAAEVSEVFSSFLEILSWLRVVPAVVAGKLMTNDFVYGEFINLTTILWQLWQAMRVFAYLVLGFVFIGMILRFFIKQEEPSKLGDALKKTFIAGILIQMSWFLLALLIDLSLVLTAAVSAVPLQVMQDQRNSVETKFEVPVVHIDADTGKMIIEQVSQEQSTYLSLDDVTPDANTV